MLDDFEPELSEEQRRNAYLGRIELYLGLAVILQDLFITQEGSLGIINTCSCAQVGDEVYILSGGYTPLVLRRLENKVYRLIGPCYVHDYMDGKAISMWRKGELDVKIV